MSDEREKRQRKVARGKKIQKVKWVALYSGKKERIRRREKETGRDIEKSVFDVEERFNNIQAFERC